MTSIVYPGQGSQYIGMSKDFYQNFDSAKKLFQSIEDYTKIKITDIIFENKSNLLDITQYTQLAIFCTSLSIFTVLKEEIDLDKLDIKFMLGHSLGEYSALASSNVLSVEDCANLLKVRGELMNNAYEANKSGMAAIIGLDCITVEKIISIKNLPFQIANDNSPMQVVISGIVNDLESFRDLFISEGAKKFLILNVSAAFHSKIMTQSEKKMKTFLEEKNFNQPNYPIISNYSANISNDVRTIFESLSKQMSNRVRWVESIKLLEANKEHKIIEIGPGKVLSGLIKRISNSFSIYNIDSVIDLKKFINEI